MRRALFAVMLVLALLALNACGASGAGALNAPATSEKPGGSSPGSERTSATGFYFDTVVTLTAYGADATLLRDLMSECARYENLLSKTRENSDVWRVNHADGQPVAVDPETWEILKRAKEISAATGGAFSVTVAPLTELWDFTGGTERIPEDGERLARLGLVGDERMRLSDDFEVCLEPGMEIDLGGIAKGYIADMLARAAAGRCTGATLNFGGNVYTVGKKPDGSDFRLGITDPFDPANKIAGVIAGHDITVVTSGTYERFFVKDGVLYHHILDPKDGLPARTDLVSATIVGQCSMDADAFATAAIVLGRDAGLAMLNEMGLDALLIDRDGSLIFTPGFSERYAFESAGGR